MTSQMTAFPRIRSDVYIRSHGRAPSGCGGWMFLVMDNSGPRPVEVFQFSAPSGTLTEAKAFARDHVRKTWPDELAAGFLSLEVAP